MHPTGGTQQPPSDPHDPNGGQPTPETPHPVSGQAGDAE